jgi:hypothetical protein
VNAFRGDMPDLPASDVSVRTEQVIFHRRGAQTGAVGQADTHKRDGDGGSRSARWHAGRCSAGGLTEGGRVRRRAGGRNGGAR